MNYKEELELIKSSIDFLIESLFESLKIMELKE